MDRKLENKLRLLQTTPEVKRQCAMVKDLTKQVKNGKASKEELKAAVSDLERLQHGLELLSAESRVFSEWLSDPDVTLPPPPKNNPKAWHYLLLVPLAIWALH